MRLARRGLHERADRSVAGIRRARSSWCCWPRWRSGGWNFSMQAMAPDFSRLSPLAGMKRLFGLRGASELGKALLKCAVVGGVCAAIVSSDLRRRAGARAHGAARRDRPRRRPRELGVRLAVRLARAGGHGRRSPAIVPVQARAAHDAPGIAGRGQGIGRPSGDQAAHPPDAADAGAAAHDAQGAHGRRGDRQPDALRGGAQVRSEEDARAAGAGEGRRSGRTEHPPHRRGTSRAGVRVAETGARPVPVDRSEQGNPGRSVRGGGAGTVVHLQGAHLESDRCGRVARPDPQVSDEYEDV